MVARFFTAALSLSVFSLLAFSSPLFSADASSATAKPTANGSGWKSGFASNGERIYYTATSERGTAITTSGIRGDDGKKITGPVACVSCHSPDGKGGKQQVSVGSGTMETLDARDIRWSVLKRDYSAESFKTAVTMGKNPYGVALSSEMPRYKISDKDLTDLMLFLEKLP